jgi:hypothetical protein
MSPLWAAVRQPILDYSERLIRDPSRGATSYFEGSLQGIAEEAAEIFRANKVFAARLTAPEVDLETFLARDVPEGPRASERLVKLEDRGMALALLGPAPPLRSSPP